MSLSSKAVSFSTFRILKGDELVAGTEITCPAQRGKQTCDACCACQGTMPGKRPWKDRPHAPSVAVHIHPHWQLVYDKKNRSFRARQETGKEPKLERDRLPGKHEEVVVENIPGPWIGRFKELGDWAVFQEDPAAAVQSIRHMYPSYTQGYLDKMIELMRH